MPKHEDIVREIEVYKYFNPPEEGDRDGETIKENASYSSSFEEPSIRNEAPISTNQTLTALAQLCAVRLNASRAMIRYFSPVVRVFMILSSRKCDR